MLFIRYSWILIWTANAYALVIENLITGQTLAKSSKKNYSIYNFVNGDTLDILCRKEERSNCTLGWVLQSPETSRSNTCETTDQKSIRYRVLLTSVDDRRKISCSSTSSDDLTENFHIVLNYTGSKLNHEEDSSCFLPTEFVCPDSLNRLHMNITVNGNFLSPSFESYLPTYELIYNYNSSEDIEISCLAYGNSPMYVTICADEIIETNQHLCAKDIPCEVKAKIKLNEQNKNRIVHCYTSNDNEPLATVRLIPLKNDADRVSTEKTPYKPEVVTDDTDRVSTERTTSETEEVTGDADRVSTEQTTYKPRVVTDDESVTPHETITSTPDVVPETTTKEGDNTHILDDINEPVFNFTSTGFYILLGCFLFLFSILLTFVMNSVCKKLNRISV